jgi:hypothetical protein
MIKVVPILLAILLVKSLVHYFSWEFLALSPIFGALISANVFLIGFLISGVLSDYKEAEKIPGELACCAEAIADECYILIKQKRSAAAKECLGQVILLLNGTLDWFYRKTRTNQLMAQIFGLNEYFLRFEAETQPNFITRLKQEQNTIRKLITRAHTIRETSFVVTGYAIVEAITFILVLGMIFININPYYENLFLISFVSFFLVYMLLFLKDLDDPFEYSVKQDVSDEVSLKPLEDSLKRVQALL